MLQTFDINDLASIGLVSDQPPYQLPPEALSFALNVRYRDGSIERLLGWSALFGTPGVAPHFTLPLSTASNQYWLYTSLTKIFVFDGDSHRNITRPDGAGEEAIATGITPIGDLTDGAGLAELFEGTTARAAAACAQKASATFCAGGATFAAGEVLTKVVIYGSNDAGFASGANPAYTISVRASDTLPVDFETDGVQIGAASGTDSADESAGVTITLSDQTTAWEHVWFYFEQAGSAAQLNFAEFTIFRRLDSDYTGSETRDWNGTILGGIPILNNGADIPQAWEPGVLTRAEDLPNWTSTMRAKIVRAMGPFLIAFNVTDSGTNKPHLVRWSHPADPGSVPSSWDVSDPAVDTGEVDLPDVNSGVILDALPLQNVMFIYKGGSIWRMSLVGGQGIFDFKTFSETTGILASRCVTLTGDGLRHVIATPDDIVVNNGSRIDSILDRRQRKTLFNKISNTAFPNSFIFTNPLYNEVWFCYPEEEQLHPNAALIWNYKTGEFGAFSEADGITFRNAVVGSLEVASSEPWDDDSDSWDSDPGPWSLSERRRVVLCGTAASKFYKLDDGEHRDEIDFTATVQREGLSIIGRKRNGEWIVDHEIRKLVTRLWPKIRGGKVKIRVGFQQLVNGPIGWNDYFEFNPEDGSLSPAAGVTADFKGSGRAFALEVRDADEVATWIWDGYKVEMSKLGRF